MLRSYFAIIVLLIPLIVAAVIVIGNVAFADGILVETLSGGEIALLVGFALVVLFVVFGIVSVSYTHLYQRGSSKPV